MIPVGLITDDDRTVRTQVTLTAQLWSAAKKKAESRGESFSEYLRRAMLIQLLMDDNERVDLSGLADKVIGSVSLINHPEWQSHDKVNKWVKKIRREWTN